MSWKHSKYVLPSPDFSFGQDGNDDDPSTARSGLAQYIEPARRFPFKIYCCSQYFNEIYMFALKMIMMSPFVHKFVLVTSPYSHSRELASEITFSPFEDIVEALGDRLYVYAARTDNRTGEVWEREKTQRGLINKALETLNPPPSDDDIIIVSDFDEMFTRQNMQWIVDNPPNTSYRTSCIFYWYSLRWKGLGSWVHPIVARYSVAKERGIREMWATEENPVNDLMGIHISYALGTVERIQRKLMGFAHQEYNKYPYTDIHKIYTTMACGQYMFPREPVNHMLQPKWDVTQHPWLRHPLLSWLNSRIPFVELSPNLELAKIKSRNPCREAIEAFHNFSVDRSD